MRVDPPEDGDASETLKCWGRYPVNGTGFVPVSSSWLIDDTPAQGRDRKRDFKEYGVGNEKVRQQSSASQQPSRSAELQTGVTSE